MSVNKAPSLGKVPFSWENAPGVCKVSQRDQSPTAAGELEAPKLPPPPPYLTESPRALNSHVPLPPGPFQPPLRSSSKRGHRGGEPFLAACKECTRPKLSKDYKKGSPVGLRSTGFSVLCCKGSCGVKEECVVRSTSLHSPPPPPPTHMIISKEDCLMRSRSVRPRAPIWACYLLLLHQLVPSLRPKIALFEDCLCGRVAAPSGDMLYHHWRPTSHCFQIICVADLMEQQAQLLISPLSAPSRLPLLTPTGW